MDAVAQWRQAQQRVVDLVGALPPERLAETVPACPAWTVRDLLAHMVGLSADVVAGNEPDDHNPVWTARQVQERKDHDVAALLAEWQALTGPVLDWMRTYNTRPLGDVVVHEQDLRGALGVPGARESEGHLLIRDRFAARLDGAVRQAGLTALLLHGPTWSATAGAGRVATELAAPDHDLARAVTARRSAAQLRRWTVRGDIGPYLPLFASVGDLPVTDLVE